MLWDRGYAVSYYATTVDSVTWADKDLFDITGGYADRTNTGLRTSASIDIDFVIDTEELIRIYMDATQDQNIAHTAIFTGYAMSPDKDINGRLISQNVPCYGVLKHADDIHLPLGWYAMAGRRGTDIIKELLDDVPLEVAGESNVLTGYIVAEDDETKLTMADKILTAIGWEMRVDGYGRVTLQPKDNEPKATFDIDYDMVEESIKVTQDLFSVPNVFRAIYEDASAIARDTTSQFSIQNRGREIWAQEQVSELTDEESLAQYADRRLKELQVVGKTIDYARRFDPRVNVGDVVSFNYDEIKGSYKVTNQKINFGHAGRTEETGVAI